MDSIEPKDLGLIHFCDAGRVLFEMYADLVDDDDHVKGDSETVTAWNEWKEHQLICNVCGFY